MNENQTTPEQMQPDFCMTVKDNSMKPDGIHKGDKVAFVRCDYVENGQMKIDLVCVKLERSASTITKLLAAALDALEVPEITQ